MQGGYPPQQGSYPPQQGGYPPQQSGQQGSYPPQQSGQQGSYPPQQGSYPPQAGHSPQQGGQQGSYPPQQGSYPPQAGHSPQQSGQQGSYPPQQGSYPPQAGQQGGYPPQQGSYPPQAGHSPQQGGYPPQQGGSNWGQSLFSSIPQQELLELRGWFGSVDKDRSGTISATELANKDWGGKKFTLPTTQLLVNAFDANKSGQIDFNEYAQLHKFVAIMQGSFYMHDTDRSNRLDIREVVTALQETGFNFNYNTVSGLIRKFTQGNWNKDKQELTFDNYIQMCALLALLRNNFEIYDTMRSGTVTLNFDQLVTIASGI